MDKDFFTYVFRPAHIAIFVIAVRGILTGENTSGFIALLIGELIHFTARGVWYFVEQRALLNHWKQKEKEKAKPDSEAQKQEIQERSKTPKF